MATEERLMNLLRRAHTVIGEALIDNAFDGDSDAPARKLHNEIGELFGLAPMSQGHLRCGATWFVAGGRVERRCREAAVNVCAECANARCDEHDDLGFEEHEGRLLCDECRSASAAR